MLGAIAGDVIGSIYEFENHKSTEFPLLQSSCRFTDDTVLTVAVAETLLTGTPYVQTFHDYFRLYPNAGYGETFYRWARTESTEPYNSWGNGSAMRVSPVGFAFDTEEEVLAEARRSAEVTHNHPQGIKGAQAVALAIWLARRQATQQEIREEIRRRFGYALLVPLDLIRPGYTFDVSCQGSVPIAITAFLESTDWEDAVRKAVSVGGDTDTIACITGGIAQAFYGEVPGAIAEQVLDRLTTPLRDTTVEFCDAYICY